MIQEHLNKIEKEFDEKFVGIHLKGRYDEYYNQNDDEYGSVSNLKEHKNFLRTSALELVKSVVEGEIKELEGKKVIGMIAEECKCCFARNQALSSSIASLQEIIKEIIK